jgi:hypothetical protein
MFSQGRQWLQISCLDAIFRMLREAGVAIPWHALETPDSRRRMRKRNLPPAHTEVPDAHEQRAIFELWLRIAVRIGRYVYENDVRHLPTDDELDGLFDELGLAPWMSSSTEEEVSGMKVMFRRYASADPSAALSARDAVRRFTIPFFIKGDRHWVSGPRERPGGILFDRHASMLRHLVLDSHDKRRRGWQLTAVQQLAALVGDMLTQIAHADPGYRTLPTYALLIAEYNARHPGAEVGCLHK